MKWAEALVLLGVFAALVPDQRLTGAPAPKGDDRDQPRKPSVDALIVDAEGKPCGDAVVEIYRTLTLTRDGEPFKATADGRLVIPGRVAHSGGHLTLALKDGERIGWCSPSNRPPPQGKEPLRIQLLSLTRTVKGTLVDESGKPLAGVRVHAGTLTNGANGYSSVPPELIPPATTDDKGAFSIRLPPGTRAGLYPNDPWRIRKQIDVLPEAEDVGRVELAEAGQVAGEVLDAAGKPVAGASVFVQAHRHKVSTGGPVGAVTDAKGRYRISGLPPASYNVLFSPPDSDIKLAAAAKDGAQVEAMKELAADFKAIEGRLLTGKVIDAASEEAVAGCYVGYYGAARPRSGAAIMGAHTDAIGNFRFYVPPGLAYVYVAESAQGNAVTLTVPEHGDVEPITLRRVP